MSIAMTIGVAYIAAAQTLMGVVVEKNSAGAEQPLPGAHVYWLQTTTGTRTGENGVFIIDRVKDAQKLVISFAGYTADTLFITTEDNIKVVLEAQILLNEVIVEGWKPTTQADHVSAINTSVMSKQELFKAACCNLSESFETNPSVDVAYTDAITGTRQIQMLGLAGANTMIAVENMPGVRGLASSQGVQFIPGSWINTIEVTKGAGSVVNGYESIAGQLNVELKKPHESEKVFANAYVNHVGRSEANANATAMIGKKWATTTLLHASTRGAKMDQNKDGFLDFPTGYQLNAINRWTYNSGDGWLAQVGVKALRDTRQGGQKNYQTPADNFSNNAYGLAINTSRGELWAKVGYQFAGKPYKSIGLQLSTVAHQHQSYYGLTTHNADEQSAYVNLIYQSIIASTKHKIKGGLSFLYDRYDEALRTAQQMRLVKGEQDLLANELNFSRTENVPGGFVEYTFNPNNNFSLVAGLRADYHNLFGIIVTPRLHTRLLASPNTTIRFSAGKGTRVANIIAENTGVLASSRQLVFSYQQTNHAYGYKPDEAWTYGANVLHDFTWLSRPGTFTVDYFYTNFTRQVVLDVDKTAREANFFALQGKSFSHSAQVQVDYEILRRLHARLAYRWLDVRTDYLASRLQKPLVPVHRSFLNIAWEAGRHWKFDYTLQAIGAQRLPGTADNPVQFQRERFSPRYFIMNAQVSKDFKKQWTFYVGVENLNNFTLQAPIISADQPFGTYFDASMVWGPVFGSMAYAGFRWKIE